MKKSGVGPTEGKKGKAKGQTGKAKSSARKKGEDEKALTPEVLEPADSDLVEKSVAFINGVVNETAEKGSRLIAQHILEAYYDNNVELAKSHNPKKPASYRALVDHDSLMLSVSSLNSMVRVEIQRDYLKSNGIDLNKLSYSHQARLIRLPDGRNKLALAKEAVEKGLSVRSLEEKIKGANKAIGNQVPLIPNLGLSFRSNPALLLGDGKRLEFVLEKDNLKRLTSQRRAKLKGEVLATRETLIQFSTDLEAIIKNLEELDTEHDEGQSNEK
ncbi:hypothetical protein ACFL2Q_05970 [Thermodesulfobacteriota bacterium]